MPVDYQALVDEFASEDGSPETSSLSKLAEVFETGGGQPGAVEIPSTAPVGLEGAEQVYDAAVIKEASAMVGGSLAAASIREDALQAAATTLIELGDVAAMKKFAEAELGVDFDAEDPEPEIDFDGLDPATAILLQKGLGLFE